MRSIAMAALAAAQLVAAPATAAELLQDQSAGPQLRGAFAGARLRVPLGGPPEAPHAGLALTMTQRDLGTGGLRFSRGLEFGHAGDRAMRLSVNGRPLVAGDTGPEGRRLGVSTLGWVAIGVGAVLVLIVAAGVTCQETNCLNSE